MDESLFVSDTVQPGDVTLADGKVHKLHFKEYSGTAFAQYALAIRSDDALVRSQAPAILIAASVCNPDGSPALSFAKACTLKPAPMNAIFAKVMEVNNVRAPGDPEKKA
ncbi:hypothetical protein [Achromobacter pestifer]